LPAEPAHPFQLGDRVYWLQALPEDGGRVVVMGEQEGKDICLTPAPFSLRTRVHEYGGRCFCIYEDQLIFNNHADGRLYVQPLGTGVDGEASPAPLTRKSQRIVGFADLTPLGNHVVAVMEETVPGGENVNSLVAIRVSDKPSDPVLLASGRDFYAAPTVDSGGQWLAWLEWEHPDMPWDRTRLMRARVSGAGGLSLEMAEAVVDGVETTVSQPGFLADGSLVFAMDGPDADWSNLYRWSGGQFHRLTDEAGEFGEAHWVFGQCRWRQVSENRLLAICSGHGGDKLLSVDIDGDSPTRECLSAAGLSHLFLRDDTLLLVEAPEDRPPHLLRYDPISGVAETVGCAPGPLLEQGYSKPRSLCCGSAEGESAWAYHYPPYHPDCRGPAGEAPPLVVMVHGGPTSRSSPAFHPLRQYFTSLGFAVLDVNHRGSTGYGRRFRQRLLGGWGEVDVTDVIACIDALAGEGRIDPGAVFIRGGSAGGYTVLRALTRFPDQFAGGACYYGIGNLVTLAQITHKFESRYTDRLIGEVFDPVGSLQPDSRYHTRSPVHDMGRLRSPLILFQGLDDKVVPPEVSREVVMQLKQRGIAHGYHEYPGEGHGFRQTGTRVDALEKETGFYRGLLGGSSSGADGGQGSR
jgi:dipeptidyl aminopeptidase/acylaminoacyl peptidase